MQGTAIARTATEDRHGMNADIKWLLARETPRLRRFAIALTGNVDQGDDLVQDTLERALRKRGQWGRRAGLRTWLYKILYRQHLNQAKRRRTERAAVSAMDDGEAIPAGQESHIEMLNIQAGLSTLSADQRDAVLLVGLENLSYDEAAEVMGVPIGTLKSRLYRGREALWTIRRGDPQASLRKVK